MFGIRKRRPPPFGGVHVDDDKDIQVLKPEQASRNDLWSEARLLLRDLIFALMIAALVVVFIVQPVKVEGTSMLPRLHDGERIFVNKLIYYDEYRWAPHLDRLQDRAALPVKTADSWRRPGSDPCARPTAMAKRELLKGGVSAGETPGL